MNHTDLSRFDNSWYDRGASSVKCMLWYMVNAFFINSPFPFVGIKIFLLRLFGSSIGKGVMIKPRVNIKYPWKLTVGDYSWIGERSWIDNLAKVAIGKNACISQGAILMTGNHNFKKPFFDLIVSEIILEDGAWIGAGAIVCPGTVCKSHSVLTAGSTGTGILEPYSVYQGNPAVKIRDRIIESA